MDSRDLDRWARLVASSCSRRRTLQVLGAGAIALGLGRRARFEALAADLGCCKCSGTLRCELDVASHGECVTVCGPRRQAIFAPNHTCTRGNSLSKVCKPKRRATGAALLAGAPGVLDLAFVDRAGAATIPGLSPVTTEALFTAEAAIAAGLVRENAAAVLFDGGVQVYHSLWQDAGDTIGVFSHLSQHLTAEAAAAWYEYALPQLGPEGAETFDIELSGIDAGTLVRFAFPSHTRPGATITRLMAMTLTGEFVNWFGIDGVDTVPDPELARAFSQAVVDALIDRPEQTASLAPYVSLLPGAAACLPEFPAASAKRAGALAARGPAGFQDQSTECETPTGNVRYTVWNGAYVPVLGAPEPLIELNRRFFAGADRVLNQSYAIGDQTWTITIVHWTDSDVPANDGETFFERRAVADDTRQLIRQGIGTNPEGAFTVLSYLLGEQTFYGIDRVIFAPPYSVSLGVVQPGEPLADQTSSKTDGTIPVDSSLQALMDELDAEASRRKSLFDLGIYAATTPVFSDPWFSEDSSPRGDEVVSGLYDFAATAAALARTPAFDGFASDGGLTYLSPEAAERAQFFGPDVIDALFGGGAFAQWRFDRLVSADGSTIFPLSQFQFPSQERAAAGFEALKEELAYPTAADVTVEVRGQTRSAAYRFQFQTEEGQAIDRVNSVVQVDEIVVTGTYDSIGPGPDPNRSEWSEEWHRNVTGDLLDSYDEQAWAGAVGQEAWPVTSGMPLVTGLGWYQSYLGIVDGEVVPRLRVPADRLAAENPGVETALSGSYRVDSGWAPIDVFWTVRSLADQAASDEYWAQLPSLMQEYQSGVNWHVAGTYVESEIPHLAHGATWNPAEGRYLVGAHLAAQAGTIVVDVGAFAPYGGDWGAWLDLAPLVNPAYEPLSEGLADLMKDALVGLPFNVFPGGLYYQPEGFDVPTSWE